eukprot:768448-Hanusia_phi.AAC.11
MEIPRIESSSQAENVVMIACMTVSSCVRSSPAAHLRRSRPVRGSGRIGQYHRKLVRLHRLQPVNHSAVSLHSTVMAACTALLLSPHPEGPKDPRELARCGRCPAWVPATWSARSTSSLDSRMGQELPPRTRAPPSNPSAMPVARGPAPLLEISSAGERTADR